MISFPNAKINLGLRIISKRDDGFHNIETVFYPVPVYDILEIVPAGNETKINITGIDIPGDKKENLVYKAWKLLKQNYNIPNVKINLHKNIPAGSGMGAGSSDASHCLLNLNKQFELNISTDDLQKMSLQLGSDCPFFIFNKPAVATGRGEVLTPLDKVIENKYLLIVFPGINISTKDAFKNILPAKRNKNLYELLNNNISTWHKNIGNDFEKYVFTIFPEIKNIKEKLIKSGAEFSLMTGSGSSVYAIFNRKPDKESLKQFDHYKLIRL